MPNPFDQFDPQAVNALDQALQEEGVTGPLADLARSIYSQESSSGKNTKTSNRGAVGGMQILPTTFAEVADKGWDINDPVQNARAGIRYLGKMLKDSGGDPRLAAIGYYGGPGAIKAARNGHSVIDSQNPEAPDTFAYADSVLSRLKGFAKGAVDAIIPAAQADELPKGNPFDQFDVPAQAQAPNPFDQFDTPSRIPPTSRLNDPVFSPKASSTTDSATPTRAKTGVQSPDIGVWTPQNVLRQVGLTARAGLSGVTAIPNMLVNGPVGAVNSLFGTHIPLASSNALADAVGLPKPENGAERFAQDVASGVAAVGPLGSLEKISSAAGPITKGIANTFSENMPAQVATSALGASGASGTRELGYGPGVQATAGLLLGGVPALTHAGATLGVRNALVGGEAGRQRVLGNILAFKDSGTTPTVGQATEGRIPRAIESVLSRAPGGAGVIAKKAENQAEEMQNHVDGLVHGLSKNVGPVEAGESVSSAIQGFKDGIRKVQNGLYATLDQHIAPAAPILTTRTQTALHDLNQSIAGAENVSQMFRNSRIAGILSSFEKDLGNSAQQQVPTGFGGVMSAGPAKPLAEATMPYEAVKRLRTLVGQEIDNSNFTSDIPRSKWRALYGALSDDLGSAAEKAGPKAAAAWKWANGFTRMMNQRLESLKGIADKDSPERVFQAALSGTNEGDTVLKRVVDALPKKSRRDLAATVIARMGRATPGNQNDVGEVFSPNTFLTNWNRMSPAAKATLFGRIGEPRLMDHLGSLAKAASNIRAGSKVFANPSGTSAAAAQYGTLGAIGMALGTGNFGLAAGLGTGVGMANALARFATSPKILNWLAEPSKLARTSLGADAIAAMPQVLSSLALPNQRP